MASNPVLAQNPGNPGTGDHPSEHICREMVPDHVPWYARGEWVEHCAYGPPSSRTIGAHGGSTELWISDYVAGPGLKLLVLAGIIGLILAVFQPNVVLDQRPGAVKGVSEPLSGALYLGAFAATLYLAWDGLKWGAEVRWSFGSSLVAAIVGLGGGLGLTYLMYLGIERINRKAQA